MLASYQCRLCFSVTAGLLCGCNGQHSSFICRYATRCHYPCKLGPHCCFKGRFAHRLDLWRSLCRWQGWLRVLIMLSCSHRIASERQVASKQGCWSTCIVLPAEEVGGTGCTASCLCAAGAAVAARGTASALLDASRAGKMLQATADSSRGASPCCTLLSWDSTPAAGTQSRWPPRVDAFQVLQC